MSTSASTGTTAEPLISTELQATVQVLSSQTLVQLVNSALRSAGNLANLLPTGTYLLFQILVPLLSNQGDCSNDMWKILTAVLLGVIGTIAIFLVFTDSFVASDGSVIYGIVTTYGLYSPFVVGGQYVAASYALNWVDFLHAVLTALVFATSTLFTENVKECFYPDLPTAVVDTIPITVGFVIAFVFVLFPTTRHGIGFPIPPASATDSTATTTTTTTASSSSTATATDVATAI